MTDDSTHSTGPTDGVTEAADLARERYGDLPDKSGTGLLYFEHPQRVAGKLGDDEGKTVAFLHDLVEDKKATEAELRLLFPAVIVDAVVAVSKTDGDVAPFEDYYRRVRSNPLALRVKLADIHDNLEPWRLALLSPGRQRYYMDKYGHALIALAEPVPDREAAFDALLAGLPSGNRTISARGMTLAFQDDSRDEPDPAL